MRPSPRIRKTIKWGGAAVTVLLVVVWVASHLGRYSRGWMPNIEHLQAKDGKLWVYGPFYETGGNMMLLRREISEWWISVWPGSAWAVIVPLWNLVGVSLVVTLVAWRLDSLARRREAIGKCPKCGYDRTGILQDAKCPECGAAPGGV